MSNHQIKNTLLLLIISFFASLFFPYCVPTKRIPQESKKTNNATISDTINIDSIRVLIADDLKQSLLKFEAPVLIHIRNTEDILLPKSEKINITLKNDLVSLKIKSEVYVTDSLSITTQFKTDFLSYEKKKYPGSFVIQILNNKLGLINFLKLTDYVSSVVAAELGNAVKETDKEAIKAVAVCVRNFTLIRAQEKKLYYDLYADSRDQIYYGVYGKSFIKDAITETGDNILMYNNTLAQVFYFSCCGGFTEDCGNVYSKDLTYLHSVRDGETPNCSIYPKFNWEEEYSSKDIIKFLVSSNYIDSDKFKLNNIRILSRLPSDRIAELEIELSRNKEPKIVVLKGNEIRNIIKSKSGSILKSTMFDIAIKKESGNITQVKIIGKGNGHGVGLCQWGAIGLSRQNKSYIEILKFYFPELTLSSLS